VLLASFGLLGLVLAKWGTFLLVGLVRLWRAWAGQLLGWVVVAVFGGVSVWNCGRLLRG